MYARKFLCRARASGLTCVSFSDRLYGAERRFSTSDRVERSPAAQSGRIPVKGKSIWFERRGTGSHPILCMPSALGTARTDFGPQFEYFGGQKAEQYTIVGCDPQGYGLSRPPARAFHLGPAEYLREDAVHGLAVMAALGYDKFSVLGWSDGGVSALMLAAIFPASMRKLVVWGANAYISDEDVALLEAVRDVRLWSKGMLATLEPIYGASLATLWSEWTNSMVAAHASGGDLCKAELVRITCPTLLFHGKKDRMVAHFHPTFIRDRVSNCDLVYFPEGKHNIHVRFAEEFNKTVHTFLSQ